MALTIGITEGGSFYVGDTRVMVTKITHSLSFKVKVFTPAMDYIFSIDDRKAVEVMQNVMLSAGNKGTDEMVKVVVDAPRHMKILREKLWKEQQRDALHSSN